MNLVSAASRLRIRSINMPPNLGSSGEESNTAKATYAERKELAQNKVSHAFRLCLPARAVPAVHGVAPSPEARPRERAENLLVGDAVRQLQSALGLPA